MFISLCNPSSYLKRDRGIASNQLNVAKVKWCHTRGYYIICQRWRDFTDIIKVPNQLIMSKLKGQLSLGVCGGVRANIIRWESLKEGLPLLEVKDPKQETLLWVWWSKYQIVRISVGKTLWVVFSSEGDPKPIVRKNSLRALYFIATMKWILPATWVRLKADPEPLHENAAYQRLDCSLWAPEQRLQLSHA